MKNSAKKEAHEQFARFYETPTRESLKELIKHNFGETDYLDFKESWPEYTKVAKHILGIANSGGGCIIFGVSQHEDGHLESTGLETIEDKADIIRAVYSYIPSSLELIPMDFTYESSEYASIIGKKFQTLLINSNNDDLPYICTSDGKGIRKNAIYYRRGTCTEEANYDELQAMINRRIENGYSSEKALDLKTELSELKVLYSELRSHSIKLSMDTIDIFQIFGGGSRIPNPNFPAEDYETFISRIIQKKKLRIERLLGTV